jgi:tol-pal system protein YbgF
MKWIGLIVLLAAILMVAGCASRGEIETMQRQLDYLERSSTQMQERLVQMDSMYRLTIDKNVTYQADLKAALAELIDKSSSIDGRLSDMEDRLNTIANQVDRGGSLGVPVARGGSASTGPLPPDTGNQSGLPQVDPDKLYNSAFSDLKANNYDLAIMEFNEYLNLFRDRAQAADAQYWLGECYYGKKDFAKAIPEFEKVEKNYPKSDKMVTALFKTGRSYEESGDKKRARVVFQRIIKEYPSSFEAKPAQDRLAGLKGQ